MKKAALLLLGLMAVAEAEKHGLYIDPHTVTHIRLLSCKDEQPGIAICKTRVQYEGVSIKPSQIADLPRDIVDTK